MLNKGTSTVAVTIKDLPPIYVSRPLFLATSTESAKVENGTFTLTKCIEQKGVVMLLNYIRGLTTNGAKNLQMTTSYVTLFQMLSVTAAAKILGMEKYTEHVYRRCEVRLRSAKSTSSELKAVTLFRQQHVRLFRILVNLLTDRVRENTAPGLKDLHNHLEQNTILAAEIQRVQEKHNYHAKREAARALAEKRKQTQQKQRAERAAEQCAFLGKEERAGQGQ